MAVVFYVMLFLFFVRLAYLGSAHRGLRNFDLYGFWIVATLGWTRNWVDGVFYPLFMRREGKETEFKIMQGITGLALIGLLILIQSLRIG